MDVRTGRHGCFDRLVVDLDGPASGYVVRYVNVFRADGSGQVIPLPGGGKIEIVVEAEGPFEDWVAGLADQIRKLT